jgi:TIR domain
MADVFVSYSRKDAARVEMLVRAIEVHGLSVWWDRSLEQGSDFGSIISKEIAAANACVVCWSKDAAESQWVRAEAQEANELKKYTGVLIAEGRAPLPFNTLNNANLAQWAGAADEMQLLNLLAEVGRLTGRQDIAGRAAAMKQALDDQAARERAKLEAERAAKVQAEADARAKIAAERLASMAVDTSTLFHLSVACERFVDEKSFLEAGRSWRSPDGARRDWFAWLLGIGAAVPWLILWHANNDHWFAIGIGYLIGAVIMLVALPVGWVLQHPIFNEPKRWRKPLYRDKEYRTRRTSKFDTKEQIEAFAQSEYCLEFNFERHSDPELIATFADRPSMWAAWERLREREDLRNNLNAQIQRFKER